TRTSGKWNACCSTIRTGRSPRLTAASRGCASAIARSGRGIRDTGRRRTPAATRGRSCRANSIEVEISAGSRDRLLTRLLQGFLEAPRERIAARLLRLHRLLEDRLSARRFLRENALRLAQLRLVAALGLFVRHDAPKIRVDDERRRAARAGDLDLRFEARHHRFPPTPPRIPASPPGSSCFFRSSGLPPGSLAVSRRSRTCMLWKSN